MAYSAGAAAFTAAYGELTDAEKARIGLLLYISPGAATQLADVQGTTRVELGTGLLDVGATIGTEVPRDVHIDETGCDHADFACLFKFAAAMLNTVSSNGLCNTPKVFTRTSPSGIPGVGVPSTGGVSSVGTPNPPSFWQPIYYGPEGISFGPGQYFGGRMLGSEDRLGSRGSYLPYGEDRTSPPSPPNDGVKFATYTRDNATGLDYADQRYYTASMGQFMTPDPYKANTGGPGDVADPGSWNRYSYTKADPINRLDPTGLADFSTTGYCYGCLDAWAFGEGGALAGGDGGGGPQRPLSDAGADRPQPGDHPRLSPGDENAEIGLKLFSSINFSAECAAYILDAFGVEIQSLQGIAAVAFAVDASYVTAAVGASLFPNNPDLAAAQQARADLSTGINGSNIGQWFEVNPNIHAAGQYGGNTIFYNAAWFAQIGTAQATYTMFHETLHLAGLGGDTQLEALMGISPDVVAVRGSESTTDKLEEVCGH